MSQKPFINTCHIPDDVFSYQDEQFYDFVRKYIGQKQANLLAFQEITNANIYLSCDNVLNILELDSSALIPYKESLCLQLNDNSYTVLPGIKSSFSYLTELLTKKRDEMARIVKQTRSFNPSSTASTMDTDDNTNMTIISNSSLLTSFYASSQSNSGSVGMIESINRQRDRITSAINAWVEKNKKKLFNADFSLVEGIDYNVIVTVNPDTAIVRCSCGIKSTLKLVHTTYQVFNYYRHLKARKCAMMKNKFSTISEEENIEPFEEIEKNSCINPSQYSCSASINNNEASSLAQKRYGSFASSIDRSTKRKRII